MYTLDQMKSRYFAGSITDNSVPFKIHLINVGLKSEYDWRLTGECGRCGIVKDFGSKKFYAFNVRLIEEISLGQQTWREGDRGIMYPSHEIIHTPLNPPLAIRFSGVEWIDIRCNIDDSMCSGLCIFTSERVLIQEAIDEVDEPITVCCSI